MAQFKFVSVPMGSGWLSGHVAVDEYYRWPDKPRGNNLCLNADTQDYMEFSSEIDRLIKELERVRKAGRRHFDKEKARTETALNMFKPLPHP